MIYRLAYFGLMSCARFKGRLVMRFAGRGQFPVHVFVDVMADSLVGMNIRFCPMHMRRIAVVDALVGKSNPKGNHD
ncbi:MAG: hypothetical protein IIC21_05955 [Chloroflexi bacterium]|nr:hypothetical protein [Chloroflexota bacterium]